MWMREARFYGGSMDGKTIKVDIRRHRIAVPVVDRDETLRFEPIPQETIFRHETYDRVDQDTFCLRAEG